MSSQPRAHISPNRIPVILLGLGLLCLVFVATPPGQYTWRTIDLRYHYTLWTLRRADHYRYDVHQRWMAVGLNAGPQAHMRIEVQKGQIHTIIDAATGKPLPISSSVVADTLPIGTLFYLIQTALQRDADIISVAYNEQFGYPERVTIDYDTETFDDEREVSIDNFEVLP